MRLHLTPALLLFLIAGVPTFAAFPPAQVRYEGVLRDLANHPLTGTFDMELRLFDAAAGGNEILIDQHTGMAAVTVTDGVFAVAFGGGTLSDGSGPGVYAAVPTVFQDYRDVYLEVRVGADTLTPRTQVLAHGSAMNAGALGGRRAPAFLDTSALAQTKAGRLLVDEGSVSPGYGFSLVSGGSSALTASLKAASGRAYLAYSDYGVWGEGNAAGGYFYSRNASGSAFAGYGNIGVQADGNPTGAIFTQSNYNGLALVARDGIGASFYGLGVGQADAAPHDFGLVARGRFPSAAGRFTDPYYTGSAQVGLGDAGTYAGGNYQGAEFRDTDADGAARVGFGAIGVYGIGSRSQDPEFGGGGYFEDQSSLGRAWLGRGDVGAQGYGYTGGIFHSSSSVIAIAYAATGNTGISATGRYVGGDHNGHHGASQYNNVAWTPYTEPATFGSHSVFGFEPKAFVQNDPADPGRSVVYVAIEGDEAGTYTRGRARLDGGIATVRLDPAFALATNPDIGLTASVTPRGDPQALAVEHLASDTLIVRGPAGSDAAFDFVVFGLRVGFETHPTVQPRHVEAAPHLAGDYPDAGKPGTGAALEHWQRVRTGIGETAPLDLTRSARLVEQARRPGKTIAPAVATATTPADTSYRVPVTGDVRAGDLIGTDPGDPSRPFGRASAGDGGIAVGFAAGDAVSEAAGGAAGDDISLALLALAGSIVACHVDATSAPIARGDLLVVSPLPGHARRAPAAPAAGSVVGQALESLDAGTGTIQVRVITQ